MISGGGRSSLPSALRDAFRYRKLANAADAVEGADDGSLKDVQDSVMEVMKEHGIDPSSPDPRKLMDPDVQRALRNAVLKGTAP